MNSTGYWKKGDGLFQSLNNLKALGVEDMPIKMKLYKHSIDIAVLENKTCEITSSRYLSSIVDIVGNCSNLGNSAPLIINGYALGVIWRKKCFCLFDLHSKSSSGNINQNGTLVLLKFETLNKLQEYVCYIGLRFNW